LAPEQKQARQDEQWELAIRLLEELLLHRPLMDDWAVRNALISACSKAGQTDRALELYDQVKKLTLPCSFVTKGGSQFESDPLPCI
jgi:pentatricopeptide repeat protein